MSVKWFIQPILGIVWVLGLNVIGSVAAADPIDDVEGLYGRALSRKERILEQSTPGKINSRRKHVLADQTDLVKQLHLSFNESMKRLGQELSSAVAEQKRMDSHILKSHFQRYYEVIAAFNSLVKESREIYIVYDRDNFLGRYGSSVALLDTKTEEVELDQFDFTVGFAFECQQQYASGFAVYRNPITGNIHWISGYKSGVAIIGVKEDGSALSESSYKTGLSSAFNPIVNQWEKASGSYKVPTASVFNPDTKMVEHQSGGYKTGIGGVYNPLTRKVQWNKQYSSGVAGYFDLNENKVKWVIGYKSGVACIWRDNDGNFFTSSSFFGGEVDDDD